jgi:dTDP-4-dehydrorhamnose reductase
MKKKALVLGSTGLIGQQLVAQAMINAAKQNNTGIITHSNLDIVALRQN